MDPPIILCTSRINLSTLQLKLRGSAQRAVPDRWSTHSPVQSQSSNKYAMGKREDATANAIPAPMMSSRSDEYTRPQLPAPHHHLRRKNYLARIPPIPRETHRQDDDGHTALDIAKVLLRYANEAKGRLHTSGGPCRANAAWQYPSPHTRRP